MEKLMIINWRWEKFTNANKYELMLDEGNKNIIISFFNKDEVDQFNSFISEQMNNYKPKHLLVLTHYNSENLNTDIQIHKSRITVNSNNDTTIKVRNIRGGNVSKEFNFIYDSNEGMINTEGATYQQQLKIENFDKVWHFYWDVIDLEYQKKNLINLWLPLAIDIQGLSEVKDDSEKSGKYFEEIKKEKDYLESLKSFPKDDEFPRWQEIKEKLNGSYKNFNPVSVVEEIMQKEYSSFDKKYFLDPNFLPNWLQEVVRVIDGKLKK